MTIKVRKSGAMATASVKVRKSGAWVAATFVRRRVSGAWVNTIPLTASASPSSVSGLFSSFTAGNKTVTSNATTVTALQGTGAAKTYSWAFVSGTAMTVTSPTSASTTFSKSLTPGAGPVSAVYRCTVSDGTYSATANVSVTLECTYDP